MIEAIGVGSDRLRRVVTLRMNCSHPSNTDQLLKRINYDARRGNNNLRNWFDLRSVHGQLRMFIQLFFEVLIARHIRTAKSLLQSSAARELLRCLVLVFGATADVRWALRHDICKVPRFPSFVAYFFRLGSSMWH